MIAILRSFPSPELSPHTCPTPRILLTMKCGSSPLSPYWGWYPNGCPYGAKLHMVPKSWKWKCSAFTQPCPALCNPMNCSPPDSAVHEILQARTPEWVVIPFSRESSRPRDRTQASCIAGRSLPLSHQGRPLCHEGEKKVKAAQSCLTLCNTVHGIL